MCLTIPCLSILLMYRHFILLEILLPISRSMSTFLNTLGRWAKVPTISLGNDVSTSLESFLLPAIPSPRNLMLLVAFNVGLPGDWYRFSCHKNVVRRRSRYGMSTRHPFKPFHSQRLAVQNLSISIRISGSSWHCGELEWSSPRMRSIEIQIPHMTASGM